MGACEGGSHSCPHVAALIRQASSLLVPKQGKEGRRERRDRGEGECHIHFQLVHIQQREQGRAGLMRSTRSV